MNKTTASLLAGMTALAVTTAKAQTYVDLSREIFTDNFESYDPGTYPDYISVGAERTYDPAITVDADNWFGQGTDNRFLQYRKVRHSTFLVDFRDNPSDVVRFSFDFISRDMPADGTYDADGRWLNFNFFADPTNSLVNTNARAHLTQLIVTQAGFRGEIAGDGPYGALDEMVHFDMFFNNTVDPILYDAPGGGTETLAGGTSDIWVNGTRIVQGYNENRNANSPIGHPIHALNIGIDSNANGIVSFDIDNVEVFGVIPEPSTYALIFGGIALGGAFYIRRRREHVQD